MTGELGVFLRAMANSQVESRFEESVYLEVPLCGEIESEVSFQTFSASRSLS